MGKNNKIVTNLKKYGVPLYCVGWISSPKLKESETHEQDNESNEQEGESHEQEDENMMVVFGGGGGAARSGVKNGILLASFHIPTNVLSELVYNYGTESELPYRMAVHPVEDSIVCAFENGCRLFELNEAEKPDNEGVCIRASDKIDETLSNVGEQKSLAFNENGSLLALGGEDGHLRVFNWEEDKITLDHPEAHKCVKDLDFSLDGITLASLGDSGPCKIWNLLYSSTTVSLSDSEGKALGFCRFSRDSEKTLLFITMKQGIKGFIGYWDVNSWEKVGEIEVEKNPISAFSISPNGKFLALGTSEGDVSIIDVGTLTPFQRIKGAHLVFVTAMEFSRDSKALASVSADSSARVTTLQKKGHGAGSLWYFIMMLLVLVLAYFWQQNNQLIKF